MPPSSRSRKRAVRLTDHALERLNRRLWEIWKADYSDQRLTNALKAEMMGISAKTASRVLRGLGNDRSVLIETFTRVKLSWHEGYCESVEGEDWPDETVDSPTHLNGAADEPLIRLESEIAAAPINPTIARRRQTLVALLATAASVVALLVLVFATSGSRIDDTVDNQIAIDLLEESRQAYFRAEYDLAAELIDKAIEVVLETGNAASMAEALKLKGDLFAVQGDLDSAIDHYQRALPMWDAFGLTAGKASLLEYYGVAEFRLGNLERAEELLTQAASLQDQLGEQGGLAGSYRTLGNIAAERGDFVRAREMYDLASATVANLPEEMIHVDLRARRAMLLHQEGEHGRALEELEACLEIWRNKEDHPRWVAITQVQMATVLIALGETVESQVLLAEAKLAYEKLGDNAGRDRAAGLLMRIAQESVEAPAMPPG